MLGGLSAIALAVLGYMGVSPFVILPVVLVCGAAWVFRPRRGPAAEGAAWSWSAYLRGLPAVAGVAVLAYGLGAVVAAIG